MGTHQGIAEPSLEVHLRLTAALEPVIPKVSATGSKLSDHDGIIRNLEYHIVTMPKHREALPIDLVVESMGSELC
jgi:hypothetical protein